jgi:hypothetical protein
MTIHADTLKATALAMVSAFNAMDLNAIMSDSWRSPSCVLQYLPLSLERPSLTNDQFKEYFAPRMPTFSNPRITVNDIVVDEKERKVWVWASGTADNVVGPYRNEYVIMMRCGEDGRAEWIGEFLDSYSTLNFGPKLSKYLEEQSSSS